MHNATGVKTADERTSPGGGLNSTAGARHGAVRSHGAQVLRHAVRERRLAIPRATDAREGDCATFRQCPGRVERLHGLFSDGTDEISRRDARLGKDASRWIVLARRLEDFGPLVNDPRSRALVRRAGLTPWTDDRSSVLSVIH